MSLRISTRRVVVAWGAQATALAAALAIGLPTHGAFAQDTEPPSPDGEAVKTHDAGRGKRAEKHLRRPSTLPKGVTQIYVPVQTSLSAGEIGKPTFVAPNVSYGVTKHLTVRLLHSESWRDPSEVVGLCPFGSDNGCDHVYNNVALDIMDELADTPEFGFTINGGTSVVSMDPMVIGVVVGASGEVHPTRWFSLQLDLSFVAAAIGRPDVHPDRLGSTTRAFFEPSRRMLLFALAGFFAPLDELSSPMVPLGIGGFCSVGANVDLGAQFVFTDSTSDSAVDEKQLTLAVAYRL